jgi:alanyl-tRNA synthetase
MLTRKQLIKKYIDFFKSKNHKEIKNSSLIPENDPTVLFTTAGMQPLVPYLLGEKHPLGKRLVNVQRCIRTGDIEEVGDSCHHTFFEMLGNWSLGDYFKKEAIEMSFEFLTKILKIPKEKISVTCFKGDKDSPKDTESENIWKSLGIKKIIFKGKEDNWWGPAGKTGPCGPDTEIFYKELEIWNNVLMQYNKNEKGQYLESKQKNIDTGMGVERTLAILNDLEDNYLTEIWMPIIKKIEELSSKKYQKSEESKKIMRIIADHLKASVFILAEEILPSNNEQGYVLRRLIRRAIRQGKKINLTNFTSEIAKTIFPLYEDYPLLTKRKKFILEELKKEEEKFNRTLEKGLNFFEKNKNDLEKKAFLLYQSYGFPLEMTLEEIKSKKLKTNLNKLKENFEKEFDRHKKLSQTASAGKFKSGLADNKEETTKLHTAAHLLLKSLKIILKDDTIAQKGSNITSERLRFDFSFLRKLTEKEIKDVEDLVNAQIEQACEVKCDIMSPTEAKKAGASGNFENKYGEKVSVYSVGDFSKEICAGPHVKNTCELGRFKIIKEESSSSGVRRIKAILLK